MMKFLEILNKRIFLSDKEKILLKLLNINSARAVDIMMYIPYKWNKKKILYKYFELKDGVDCILFVKIKEIKIENNYLKIYALFDSKLIELIFFKFNVGYIKSVFKDSIWICGQISSSFKSINSIQIIHPQILNDFNEERYTDKSCFLEAIYNSTKNIKNNVIRSIIHKAHTIFYNELKISDIKSPPEWLPKKILDENSWPSFFESLEILHQFNKNFSSFEMVLKAKDRIVFDEFLIKNISKKLLKENLKSQNGRVICGDFWARDIVLKNIGFELTCDQKKILEKEIYVDQSSPIRMNRMIQGDVGSGKTIVAMMALLNAAEAGYQSILMSPTEILSRQHYEYFVKILQKSDLLCGPNNEKNKIDVIFLSSKSKKKKKIIEKILNYDESLAPQIIIGTHALFQEKVQFKKVGLIVIDEQHRFGVKSRNALINKDNLSDVILMSATPIPRTMAMIEFGYLDHSILRQKPLNRQKVFSSVFSNRSIEKIYGKIKEFIARDERVYWICPLIEESEKLDLIAIEKRIISLKEYFDESIIGVIHGKMKEDEVLKTMNEFKLGERKILLATTIIEVGVSIENATLIVIEESQRFGLSQLHQLRGRVGRGELKSFCIFLYNQDSVSKQTIAKLKNLSETDDGFEISELDLKFRGYGEISGLRQSGFEEYLFSNPYDDEKLFILSNKLSDLILSFMKNKDISYLEKFKILENIFNHSYENI